MLNIVILVLCIVLLIVYNLRKQLKRNNMGKVIIFAARNMENYFSLFIGVAYILFFYRVIKNYMYNLNLINILMAILMLIIALNHIYSGLKKNEIREKGIYTPIGIWEWHNVKSYELTDYRKYNEYYEGNKYLLKLKVKRLKIGKKEWYRSLEFDIEYDQRKTVEEILTIGLQNKTK